MPRWLLLPDGTFADMSHSSLLLVSVVVILECVILLWFWIRSGRKQLRKIDFLLDLAGITFALFMVVSITRAQLVAGEAAPHSGDGVSAPLLAYDGPLTDRESMAAPELVTNTPTPLASLSPTRPPLPTATLPATIHLVQRGEELSFVAARYGTTEEAILLANGLTSSELTLDQRLVIPPPGVVGWVPTPGPTEAVAVASLPPSPTPRTQPTLHVVAEGEILGTIARQYGTSIELLIAANPELDPDRLSIGQELRIPAASPSPAPIAVASVIPNPVDGESEPTVPPTATRERPTEVATRTPVPSPTVTLPLPTATATATVTVTPLPSPTATLVATVTSPPLPSATPLPPTATVAVVEPIAAAPRLLSPSFEQEFVGPESVVTLRWSWNYPLEPDQTFELQLWTDGQQPSARAWVSATTWDVPPAYFNHSWNWRVVVVQGNRQDGRQEISLPSSDGRFHWR